MLWRNARHLPYGIPSLSLAMQRIVYIPFIPFLQQSNPSIHQKHIYLSISLPPPLPLSPLPLPLPLLLNRYTHRAPLKLPHLQTLPALHILQFLPRRDRKQQVPILLPQLSVLLLDLPQLLAQLHHARVHMTDPLQQSLRDFFLFREALAEPPRDFRGSLRALLLPREVFLEVGHDFVAEVRVREAELAEFGEGFVGARAGGGGRRRGRAGFGRGFAD